MIILPLGISVTFLASPNMRKKYDVKQFTILSNNNCRNYVIYYPGIAVLISTILRVTRGRCFIAQQQGRRCILMSLLTARVAKAVNEAIFYYGWGLFCVRSPRRCRRTSTTVVSIMLVMLFSQSYIFHDDDWTHIALTSVNHRSLTHFFCAQIA